MACLFGPARNPRGQLGTIAFFLYGIVAVSGIYLCIFFSTSVADTCKTVKRCDTHAMVCRQRSSAICMPKSPLISLQKRRRCASVLVPLARLMGRITSICPMRVTISWMNMRRVWTR